MVFVQHCECTKCHQIVLFKIVSCCVDFIFIKRRKKKKTTTSWASWKRYKPRDAASLSRVGAGRGCRSALSGGCRPGGEQPAAPCQARAAVWWLCVVLARSGHTQSGRGSSRLSPHWLCWGCRGGGQRSPVTYGLPVAGLRAEFHWKAWAVTLPRSHER